MTIWPLSQGELAGVVEDLVPALRADPAATVAAHPTSATTRADYVDRVCAGGFPLAVRRSGSARDRWFDDYVRTSMERDALELARIRQRQVLRDLLGRLAGRTGQILNLADASEGLGVDRKTVEEYTRLLADLFLVARLPAWGKTLRARAAARPKLHVVDSGLAARLMRVSPAKLATLDTTALTEFGNLLETFVVGELRKQVSWLEETVTVGHWRTHDHDEVDFVIEFDDGGVIAFEVNANERVTGGDFKGLRKLREALGSRFIAGVAFSTGARSYTYQDRLECCPWTGCGPRSGRDPADETEAGRARRTRRWHGPVDPTGPRTGGAEAAGQGLHRAGDRPPARRLPHTVHSYLGHIYRKLDVCDRMQAVLLARDLGLLTAPPTAPRPDPGGPTPGREHPQRSVSLIRDDAWSCG